MGSPTHIARPDIIPRVLSLSSSLYNGCFHSALVIDREANHHLLQIKRTWAAVCRFQADLNFSIQEAIILEASLKIYQKCFYACFEKIIQKRSDLILAKY